jgi:hypothetical protein
VSPFVRQLQRLQSDEHNRFLALPTLGETVSDTDPRRQGDQIERIFDISAIVYFGRLKNCTSSLHTVSDSLFTEKKTPNFDKKYGFAYILVDLFALPGHPILRTGFCLAGQRFFHI